jgi:hypothetical protein
LCPNVGNAITNRLLYQLSYVGVAER